MTNTATAMNIARRAAEINFDIDPYNGMGFDGMLVSYYTQLNSGDIEAMIDDLNWMAEEEPAHAEECMRLIEQAEAFAAEPVTLESVAAALNEYSMDSDPYEYRNCFETKEEGLAYHIETLKNDADYVIESLKLDLEGTEGSPEDYAVITQLLHDVRLVVLIEDCKKAHKSMAGIIGKTAADSGICSILSAKAADGEITMEDGEYALKAVTA